MVLGVFSSSAQAQTPAANPSYGLMCADCNGTEYFGDTDGGSTAGCQDYEQNLYENWTPEGESSPDPKFLVAAQTDIIEVNQTFDTNF